MSVLLEPDQPVGVPVAIVNQWLKAMPRVTAICSKRISHTLNGTLPAIRLTSVSRPRSAPEEALARVQIECWADDYDTAARLAEEVSAAVPRARGDWPAGRCAGGGVALGPLDSPDENTGRNRTLLDVELWIYPAPPAP